MDSLDLFVGPHGIWLIWANVFLTQIGLPLPATPALLVAGSVAADDTLNFGVLMAGSIAASLLADTLWYFAGARYGRMLVARIGRLAGRDDLYVQRVELSLTRWGSIVLVVGKFVPGIALLAPPIAGIARVRPAIFLAADALGCALWAGLPMGLGALCPEQVQQSAAAIGQYGAQIGLVLAAGVLATLALLWTRTRSSIGVSR